MGWAIALHGGAGLVMKSISPAARELAETALNDCLDAGIALLSSSKSALDTVEFVVRMLENNPIFNSGVGSVLTADGTVEMEACIVEGHTGNCGAVSGLSTVVNPVSLARLVMERTQHVYLAFEGAERFAKEQGVERKENTYFITKDNQERLKRVHGTGECVLDHTADHIVAANGTNGAQFETVGCVAVDVDGRCAAATSTGGLVNKRAGRIGDTPLVGAGTYANEICAISATGRGEQIIKCLVAKDVAALVEYKHMPLQEAVNIVVAKKLGENNGGLVSVSSSGEVAMQFNTLGMYRACATENGHRQVGIWKDDWKDTKSLSNGYSNGTTKSSAVVIFDKVSS